MEFEIDVQHGLNGHVEITDYSKEYGQYYPEDAEGMRSPDKFKYSQSNSINVLIRVNTDKATLIDVLLDQHDQDKETVVFDVDRDGYFTVTHFILPTLDWVNDQLNSTNNLLENYDTVYYVRESKIYKRPVIKIPTANNGHRFTLDEEKEATIRELLERNVEGTTIQKCQVDIFYTGYLQECYINHCRGLFNKLMAHCRPDCKPKEADSFPRDFLWMTLNVMDYIIQRGQFLEAQRILEEINYCGGFCNNTKKDDKSMCGCHQNVQRKSCGCS